MSSSVLAEWERLLDDMELRAQKAHKHHSEMSTRRRQHDDRITLSVLVLSALTGASALSLFALFPDLTAKIIIGLLGVATVLCTGVQQHFRFGQRAADHGLASGRADAALALIRLLKVFPPKSVTEAKDLFDKLNKAILGIPGPASAAVGEPIEMQEYRRNLERLDLKISKSFESPSESTAR